MVQIFEFQPPDNKYSQAAVVLHESLTDCLGVSSKFDTSKHLPRIWKTMIDIFAYFLTSCEPHLEVDQSQVMF